MTAVAAGSAIRLDFRLKNELSGFQLIYAAAADGAPPLLVGHCAPAEGMAVLYRQAGRQGWVPLGHAGTIRGTSAEELRARVRGRLAIAGPWWTEAVP